ncbi:MAG: hypothetical protein WD751_09480 [Anaerolineales bacterium]
MFGLNLQTIAGAIIAAVVGGLLLRALSSPFQTLLNRARRWRKIKLRDESFLGMSGDKNTVFIDSYQAILIPQDSVEKITGYVRSTFTNQRVPIVTNLSGTAHGNRFLQSASFFGLIIRALPFPPIAISAKFEVKGIDRLQVGDFLENWGDFTVCISLDGEEHRKHYSLNRVYKHIMSFRRQNEDPRVRLM